ncbi:MAG: hypothetical protein ACSHXY_10220 [Alphaproteobacteria bacterium]
MRKYSVAFSAALLLSFAASPQAIADEEIVSKDIKKPVEKAIKDSQSLDEILAAKPLADLGHLAAFTDEEKMVRIAYHSLTEK